MTRRQEIALVAVLTAVGAALRVFQIGASSLWLDELFSVAAARGDWMSVITATAAGDTNPPLYNLLLHAAMQLGGSEVMVRLPSCLSSIATIPLMYALARNLFDTRAAWLATLVIAVDPFQVIFAQEARMYALLGFLSLAAALFFRRAWTKGGRWNWSLFALAQALALYTHTLAVLNLFALDIYAIVDRRELQAKWRPLLLAHLVAFAAFLPWLGNLWQQTSRVRTGFWSSLPSPLVLITTPYLFLFGDALPPVLMPAALFAALALGAFALAEALRALVARRPGASGLQFALMILLVPLCALYLISLYRPIFVERTLLPASFGLILLLAWGGAQAKPRMLNLALAGLVVTGMVAGLVGYYSSPNIEKPPMREAVQVLSAQIQPGDVVLHTSDSSALAFDFYAPQFENHFMSGDPDYAAETTRGRTGRVAGLIPEDWSKLSAASSRVWLVVALDHNVEYQRERVREMDATSSLLKKQNVGGIDIYLYQLSH